MANRRISVDLASAVTGVTRELASTGGHVGLSRQPDPLIGGLQVNEGAGTSRDLLYEDLSQITSTGAFAERDNDDALLGFPWDEGEGGLSEDISNLAASWAAMDIGQTDESTTRKVGIKVGEEKGEEEETAGAPAATGSDGGGEGEEAPGKNNDGGDDNDKENVNDGKDVNDGEDVNDRESANDGRDVNDGGKSNGGKNDDKKESDRDKTRDGREDSSNRRSGGEGSDNKRALPRIPKKATREEAGRGDRREIENGRRSGIQMREGDWLCPSCTHHNFAYRRECRKCHRKRENGKEGDRERQRKRRRENEDDDDDDAAAVLFKTARKARRMGEAAQELKDTAFLKKMGLAISIKTKQQKKKGERRSKKRRDPSSSSSETSSEDERRK